MADDDIKKRLREAADQCLSSYEAWEKDKKKSDVRESLMEAVHEMRKVASRLEIEMAISERDNMAQKPIPIPPHRDAKRRHHDNGNNGGNDFDGNSNYDGGNKPQQSRTQRRRPSSGGGGKPRGGKNDSN